MRRLLITLLTIAAMSLPGAVAQELLVAVTFDGGGWFDKSFNEGTWQGMTRAVRELADETPVDVLIYNGPPDSTGLAMRRMAGSGLDLVVAAGFLQAEAIEAVSAEFPLTHFVLIDEVVTERPNVRSVTFKDQEGSYLVGYLAGVMSQTGVVGFVGGMDVPLIRNFQQGFTLGVTAACPDCTVLAQMIGTEPSAWDDPAAGRALAAAQHSQGADIIFAAAGASGMGVIDFVTDKRCYRPTNVLSETPLTAAVAALPKDPAYDAVCPAGTQPLFFIGVDSNQNYLGDTDDDPSTMNHGLTSMLKRVDVAAYQAVIDVARGDFQSGTQELGLAEKGVYFAVDDYNQALIPGDVLDLLDAVTATIVDGLIEVPDHREQ